jgi:hypothetical protein
MEDQAGGQAGMLIVTFRNFPNKPNDGVTREDKLSLVLSRVSSDDVWT